MNIEMPNRNEREQCIQAIVNAAVPRKKSLTDEVRHLYKAVGFKNAFCGVGDAVASAAIVSFCILFFITSIFGPAIKNAITAVVHFPTMFFAPILYFSVFAFTSWKERMTGTWEVISSCRYNLRYITSVRLIIVSAAGIIFVPIATFPLLQTDMYQSVVTSALLAALTYSTMSLLALLISESFVSKVSVPVIWAAGWSLAAILFSPIEIESFLASMPLALSVSLICALFVIYLIELRMYIKRTLRLAYFMEGNYA
ncbi:MAG: hypothetical protein FWD44_04385 [Oscillospiraceae bacterium]|nr:hypothetical protein [Oscillospiraceae bacterium]